MFQGPKGYIAQICEEHLQMETVQQNGRFTLFSSKFPSSIYSILFVHNSPICKLTELSFFTFPIKTHPSTKIKKIEKFKRIYFCLCKFCS